MTAADKTPTKNDRESVIGDDGAPDGTDGDTQKFGEERVPVDPTAVAKDSSAPLTTIAIAPPTAKDPRRVGVGVPSNPLGGGAASRGDGGGGVAGGGGGGSGAATLLASDGGATFVLVAKEHLVGTWLAVFVRASMLQEVSDIRTGAYREYAFREEG